MKLHRIKSSNLRAIGYDAKTKTLEVAFRHGGTYDYHNVPAKLYRGLSRAKSHGHYFESHLKAPGIAFEKVK